MVHLKLMIVVFHIRIPDGIQLKVALWVLDVGVSGFGVLISGLWKDNDM